MGFEVNITGNRNILNGPDSFFGYLDFESISKEMLNEAKEDIVKGVKAAVRQSVKHTGDSELVNSVKAYEPHMTSDGTGAVLSCTFSGKSTSGNTYTTTDRGRTRVKPVLNSDKAFWLEYGVAGRQAAAPWRDRAMNSIEPKIVPKMQRKFEKEMGAE